MKIWSVAQPNLIYILCSCELSWNNFARTLYLSWYLIKYLHDVMKLSIVKYISKEESCSPYVIIYLVCLVMLIWDGSKYIISRTCELCMYVSTK